MTCLHSGRFVSTCSRGTHARSLSPRERTKVVRVKVVKVDYRVTTTENPHLTARNHGRVTPARLGIRPVGANLSTRHCARATSQPIHSQADTNGTPSVPEPKCENRSGTPECHAVHPCRQIHTYCSERATSERVNECSSLDRCLDCCRTFPDRRQRNDGIVPGHIQSSECAAICSFL